MKTTSLYMVVIVISYVSRVNGGKQSYSRGSFDS